MHAGYIIGCRANYFRADDGWSRGDPCRACPCPNDRNGALVCLRPGRSHLCNESRTRWQGLISRRQGTIIGYMKITIPTITDLGKFFTPPYLAVDEQRKRGFLALFLLTVVPVLLVFGLANFLADGMSTEVLVISLGLLIGLTILSTLHALKNMLPVFRVGVLAVVSLLTFEVATGNGHGVAFLWFYFHPVAAFFLFGIREGLFWVFLSWSLSLAFLVFNVGPHSYDLAIGIRFMVTYTLVSILSYGLESSRHRYYTQLLVEKTALEAALQQVKTLQGLLPICASCKKIRDDAGYWHQVESYLSRHAAVEFSHSICPDCRLSLYAEVTRRNNPRMIPLTPDQSPHVQT